MSIALNTRPGIGPRRYTNLEPCELTIRQMKWVYAISQSENRAATPVRLYNATLRKFALPPKMHIPCCANPRPCVALAVEEKIIKTNERCASVELIISRYAMQAVITYSLPSPLVILHPFIPHAAVELGVYASASAIICSPSSSILSTFPRFPHISFACPTSSNFSAFAGRPR